MTPEKKQQMRRHAREEGRAWLWGTVIAAGLYLVARLAGV